ncbi:calpain-6, partial [Brachionus plicatilis]
MIKYFKGVIRPFKDQVFDELKSEHDESNLFEDPLFAADGSSLYFTQMPPQGVMWLRPKEANPDAEFVSAGFGRCDMDQGYLGNCWFIAGCVGIMQCPKLFAK